MSEAPLYLINSSAPTRICDNGGWTDTWFAEYGRVFHIAIEPRAEVQIAVYPENSLAGKVVISAENYGDTYVREPGTPWQQHPLIEAAIDHFELPDNISIHVQIQSDAPPGAAIGTSASMTVALLGGLDFLSSGRVPAHEIAVKAHHLETEILKGQSGVQDQLAAAYGGINYIEIAPYPSAQVTTIRPSEEIYWELQRRLLLVCLGKPHKSSQVHEKVLEHLEKTGPNDARFEALRKTAGPARNALLAGDFEALGQTFIENTEGQRALYPGLISEAAQEIIDIAHSHKAFGWKVNGAGGDGGSVAILMDGFTKNQRSLKQELSAMEVLLVIEPRLSRRGLVRYFID